MIIFLFGGKMGVAAIQAPKDLGPSEKLVQWGELFFEKTFILKSCIKTFQGLSPPHLLSKQQSLLIKMQ